MNNKFYPFLFASAVAFMMMVFLFGLPLFSFNVIAWGIVFLVVVTLLSYQLTLNTVNDKNPNKFIRMVMGMTMMKFFLCILGLGALFLIVGKKNINKPDIFLLMGFYLFFTMGEAFFLSKIVKNK
jgi:hypothetical protein